MNAEPAEAAAQGVKATLCRMALLRSQSLAVNGAYKHAPDTSSDSR